MRATDYPVLHQSADRLSAQSQSYFFRLLATHLVLLVIGAALSVFSLPEASSAILQVVVLLGALSCSILLAARRPDQLWYFSRAVAESVKTLTWRFVIRVEPFAQVSDAEAMKDFLAKLSAVVKQNEAVARALEVDPTASQITPAMSKIRAASLEERRKIYAEGRVADQLTWYARKASDNRGLARRSFAALIAVNGLAVIAAVARVAVPEVSYWPTDILVTAAASVLTWMQARRYSDLAASYSLAATEIGLIADLASLPSSEVDFHSFVRDAENAFSREHTQWTARKDV
jgi:hypothetical protein